MSWNREGLQVNVRSLASRWVRKKGHFRLFGTLLPIVRERGFFQPGLRGLRNPSGKPLRSFQQDEIAGYCALAHMPRGAAL
jgi:hypothetical protein